MIAVIDCCGSNIASVHYALRRIGVEAVFTHDPEVVARAHKVILPGVGSAAHAMAQLEQYQLVETIRALECPLLGVCLGMQLLFEYSEEGDVPCMGLLAGQVRRLPDPGLVIPHMGWNTLEASTAAPHPLTANTEGSHVYFVHSYYVPRLECTLMHSRYGVELSAVVGQGNRYGMQFHPEKSAAPGQQLLENFIQLQQES